MIQKLKIFLKRAKNSFVQYETDTVSEFTKEYFKPSDIKKEYVGFIDILGFSKAIDHDYENMLQRYNDFINHVKLFSSPKSKDLNIRILSDAIILTSDSLNHVLQTTNLLLHGTLAADFMTRGGIASGKHIDIVEDENFYTASEALVKAVALEKTCKYPCILIHEELHPSPLDLLTFSKNNFQKLVLYFRGEWIVNPFNIIWGTSAATRVKQLKAKHPNYALKYDWFLDLYDAVKTNKPLIPNKGPYYFPKID